MQQDGSKKINNLKLPPFFLSHSAKETEEFGKTIARELPKKAILCFFGDLGSGKTTLMKGLISTLAHISPHEIQSPTFTTLNIYEGKQTVYHFDLYRLANIEEFIEKGFTEYLSEEGICCIEWAEKIVSILPDNHFSIRIEYRGQKERLITLWGF
ncbi:MAG: tRNA (adenosine(37)-N6)-threonylcarbamoyltransferase complex ATPase subunit type 1 TsaE [Simkania negevensis]|nr:tRNA (adenosine(37)-N6)-threonylcarbamoyltransferase complex ATPase subunit type 1 TsaE [Simkania negevensis]